MGGIMKRTYRKPSKLSESLHERLNAYALAASAAGVGMLALTQPSEAKTVYTPIHHVIKIGESYDLDLNRDGEADFRLVHRVVNTDSGHASSLYASAASFANKNEVQGTMGSHSFLASALKRGARIPKGHFSYKGVMAYACTAIFCSKYNRGNWINVTNRYLGLKFRIHGKTHYGWARLTVQIQYPATAMATLTGYAYETIPNKPIIAGKTHGKMSSRFSPPVSATWREERLRSRFGAQRTRQNNRVGFDHRLSSDFQRHRLNCRFSLGILKTSVLHWVCARSHVAV